MNGYCFIGIGIISIDIGVLLMAADYNVSAIY